MARRRVTAREKQHWEEEPKVAEAELDPIQQAIAAKQRRREEALRAALKAAAASAAPNITTAFFDEPKKPVAPAAVAGSTHSLEAASTQSNGTLEDAGAAQSEDSSANPLASLLGYSHGDSSDDEGSKDSAHDSSAEEVAAQASSKPAESAPQAAEAAKPEAPAADNLDAELASFMEELESSGLLKDEEQPGVHEPASKSGVVEDSGAAAQPVSTAEDAADLNNAAAEAGAEVQSPAADAAMADGPDMQRADATADAAASEPAEQRVLGDLEGLPGWHEVMDMGSGQVYFWDSATNEVAWDPPQGAQPRSKQQTDAVFAEAQAEAQGGARVPEGSTAGSSGVEPGAAQQRDATASGGTEAAHEQQRTGADAGSSQKAGEATPAQAEEAPETSTIPEPAAAAAKPPDAGASAAKTVTGPLAPSPTDGGESGAHAADQREEGQLEEGAGEGDAAVAAAAPPVVTGPSDEVGETGRALVMRLAEAVRQLCLPVPDLVRLAIEAATRYQDWLTLATTQRQAVVAADAAGSESSSSGSMHAKLPLTSRAVGSDHQGLTWGSYEAYMSRYWAHLASELPAAIADAEQIAAQQAKQAEQDSNAQLEDGELGEAGPPPSVPAEPNEPATPAEEVDMDMDMETDESPATPAVPAPVALVPLARGAGAAYAASQPAAASAGTAAHPRPGHMYPARHAPHPAWGSYYPAAPHMPFPYQHSYYAPYGGHVHGYLPPVVVPALPQMSAFMQPAASGAPGTDAKPPLPSDAPPLPSGDGDPPLPAAGGVGNTQPPPLQASQTAVPAATTSQSAAAEYLQAQMGAGALAAAAAAVPSSGGAHQREYKAEALRPVQAEALPSGLAQQSVAATGTASDADAKKRKRDAAPAAGAAAAGKKKKAMKLPKSANSLINKWQAVRKDLVDEEDEDEVPDPAALERKRLREAEEWRLQQLRAGATPDDNANFQPVAGDWRSKVQSAKKRGKADAKEAAADSESPAGSSKAGQKPDLDALSKGLPAGWRAMWDKASGDVYYGNLTTKATSWERPA